MYKHTAADHLRKVDGLAGSLYMQNASLKRHRASPLVTEREQFLQYLLQRGISVGFVQRVALSGHPKPANEGHLKTGQRE